MLVCDRHNAIVGCPTCQTEQIQQDIADAEALMANYRICAAISNQLTCNSNAECMFENNNCKPIGTIVYKLCLFFFYFVSANFFECLIMNKLLDIT